MPLPVAGLSSPNAAADVRLFRLSVTSHCRHPPIHSILNSRTRFSLSAGRRDMNGSEFALRIALSDVIEKWKRSQNKCKYFEQCRDTLAKELQRVKQDNENLVRENCVLQASLETSASLPNRTDNVLADAIRQAKSHSPLVPASPADRLRHEEDVKQIYQHLLSEMQRDVTQAALKSPRGMHPQESAGSAYNKNTLIEDDAGVEANNSVGRELVVGKQPVSGTSAGGTNQRPDHPHWNKDRNDNAHDGNVTGVPRQRPGDEQSVDSKHAGAGRSRLPAAGQPEPHDDEDPDDEKALSHVYAKIIAALTADLNKATQTITSQKEKLAKLRSKQLRSYFRRLKGEDQQSGNIPNPSASRCHFEHV